MVALLRSLSHRGPVVMFRGRKSGRFQEHQHLRFIEQEQEVPVTVKHHTHGVAGPDTMSLSQPVPSDPHAALPRPPPHPRTWVPLPGSCFILPT